jgi:adenylosuccinate synthase
MDVLSGLPEIKVCTAYKDINEETFAVPPLGISQLDQYKPVYETLPGWQEDLTSVRNWDDLPENARVYIRFVEKISGVRVMLASVGPERSQVVEVPA